MLVCCQKLLTLDASYYLIQFSIVQTSAPFPVDFACVCKICYTKFDATRLEKNPLKSLTKAVHPVPCPKVLRSHAHSPPLFRPSAEATCKPV